MVVKGDQIISEKTVKPKDERPMRYHCRDVLKHKGYKIKNEITYLFGNAKEVHKEGKVVKPIATSPRGTPNGSEDSAPFGSYTKPANN